MDFKHTSVLLEEVIENLNIRPNGIYVDGTLGGAGHSRVICEQLSENGRLIGIDQDTDALEAATSVLESYGQRVQIVHSNYEAFASILSRLGIDRVDGILLDLGVSSYQLDTDSRGFSYMKEGPLDMRMNAEQAQTAYDIVNGFSAEELTRIFKVYGEERYAKPIAAAICQQRERQPLSTTLELVEVIRNTIPMKAQRDGGHPAKRVFQAIRIELNRELEVLRNTLETMVRHLTDGGRLCVITFHSLEDRIVKQEMKRLENPCTCPAHFPVCVCGQTSLGRVISRKPILPGAEELLRNSRSASAKLRVFERRISE